MSDDNTAKESRILPLDLNKGIWSWGECEHDPHPAEVIAHGIDGVVEIRIYEDDGTPRSSFFLPHEVPKLIEFLRNAVAFNELVGFRE